MFPVLSFRFPLLLLASPLSMSVEDPRFFRTPTIESGRVWSGGAGEVIITSEFLQPPQTSITPDGRTDRRTDRAEGVIWES